MNQLSDRNVEIIDLYKSGCSRSELSEAYGISRERVRQIINETGESPLIEEEFQESIREKRRLEGWITRKDKTRLTAEYRYDRQMFQEDQIAGLYLAGMSMTEVARVIFGTDSHGYVWQLLKQEGIDRRIPGQYEHTISPNRYPWDAWTDGEWHEVKQGREFDCKPACFRRVVYTQARQGGRKATVYIDGKTVRFCFFVPGLQQRPRLEDYREPRE